MSAVTVITEAVREEARKWRRLADSMDPIQSRVADLGLSASAFFIGDANTSVHSAAYDGFHDFMKRILGTAVTEFEQLGAALDKMADAYDNADEIASLDLNSIYAE